MYQFVLTGVLLTLVAAGAYANSSAISANQFSQTQPLPSNITHNNALQLAYKSNSYCRAWKYRCLSRNKYGRCLRSQKYCARTGYYSRGTCVKWTKRCVNKRICYRVNAAGGYYNSGTYRYQRCYRCVKYIYPNNRYRSLRTVTHRRYTCHKNVAVNLSGAGFRCVAYDRGTRYSGPLKCRNYNHCNWYCSLRRR